MSSFPCTHAIIVNTVYIPTLANNLEYINIIYDKKTDQMDSF